MNNININTNSNSNIDDLITSESYKIALKQVSQLFADAKTSTMQDKWWAEAVRIQGILNSRGDLA